MTSDDVMLETQVNNEKHPSTKEIPIVHLDMFSSTPKLELKYSKQESLGDRFRRLLFRTSVGNGIFLSGDAIEATGSLHMSDTERAKMESGLDEFAKHALERARQAKQDSNEQAES